MEESGITSAQGQEIDFGSEMILKIDFQAHEVVEVWRRDEFDQHINVAVSVCAAAGTGTEQPQVFDAMPLDRRPQGPESLSDCDLVEVHVWEERTRVSDWSRSASILLASFEFEVAEHGVLKGEPGGVGVGDAAHGAKGDEGADAAVHRV